MNKELYAKYYRGKYAGADYDASWRLPMWERVYIEAGADEQAERIVEAFKVLYGMYTDDLVKWYANLYDPYYGAYYCTTSGKENEGFVPEIESTSQALNFLNNSGLASVANNDWRTLVSKEFKDKLIAFSKRLQDPSGFFYHLMKTKEEGDSHVPKRGRDLGWCTGMLERLGARPTYDTPNGIKGDGIDYKGIPVSSFSHSEASDEPTTMTRFADYLESRETLLEYLNTKIDVKGSFYSAGNALNATYSQYAARDKALEAMNAGYSLADTLIEWLNAKIDHETGYCSPIKGLAGTNGFFKIIPIYNTWNKPYPDILKVTDTVISVLLSDEETAGNSCSVYNLWSAMSSIRYNAIHCQPEDIKDKVIASINDKLKANAPLAILKTFAKQSAFQKPDGAFGHHHNGNPTHHQGRIPTGLGIDEGNVDAIGKCTTGITGPMFSAFGYTPVPIYGEREWRIYEDIINNAKPVIKKNTVTYR